LQKDILLALHYGAIGGHSGFHATYHRVKHLFSWPGLKNQVKQFVASCSVCQQAKSERVAYPGLLEPLKIPWQVVTKDFINGLPKSSGYDYHGGSGQIFQVCTFCTSEAPFHSSLGSNGIH
jgi:hypothetical protein